MMFVHDNWATPEVDIVGRIGKLAEQRNLEDLTCTPVLTWSTDKFLAHVDACMQIPGAELAFGGKALEGHSVPAEYVKIIMKSESDVLPIVYWTLVSL